MSTRGASAWVLNTPTGLPDWTRSVSSSSRSRSVSTMRSKHSQSLAARPSPPYTTSSPGRSATSGSRLFISMRSGASVSQLRALNSGPTGERTTRFDCRLPSMLMSAPPPLSPCPERARIVCHAPTRLQPLHVRFHAVPKRGRRIRAPLASSVPSPFDALPSLPRSCSPSRRPRHAAPRQGSRGEGEECPMSNIQSTEHPAAHGRSAHAVRTALPRETCRSRSESFLTCRRGNDVRELLLQLADLRTCPCRPDDRAARARRSERGTTPRSCPPPGPPSRITCAPEGYRTCLSGKMHFVEPDQLHGFEERLTTDICPASFDWTQNWDHPCFQRAGPTPQHGKRREGPGIAERSLQQDYDYDVSYFASRWLYDHARRDRERPFFLCASFDPPARPLRDAPEVLGPLRGGRHSDAERVVRW